jgi:hypothetical protein
MTWTSRYRILSSGLEPLPEVKIFVRHAGPVTDRGLFLANYLGGATIPRY